MGDRDPESYPDGPPSQPSGTVTLVFTDIEGSTRLLDELGVDAYRDALGVHRRVVREACGRYSGYEVDYEGDAFFYAFASAQEAAAAVSEAMAGLDGGPIQVRAGLHTGEPALDPPKYVGLDVHRAARLMASAHGGQVVVSASTAALIGGDGLVDLGEHRFKDLAAAERVFQLGEGVFPPIRSLYRSNLPVPATAFLGRERELAQVVERLSDPDSRLLTLTGPGGTGKTRLALQAAAEASELFPDGVWWAPLAPLRDPGLIVSSLAQVLEVKERPGRSLLEAVVEHLSGKRLLVLFDNVEHLLPAAATEVAGLRAAAGPTLLVTSRERLQLDGEHTWPVPPLETQDGVELFLARARQLDPSFAHSSAVDELCERLDQLPLALELAAARTSLFSAEQLIERLGQRLDLLTGGRDADPRQQTLRTTIEWSYDLLDAEEQRLFRGLSVFAGGCTYEAAEVVCDADPDTLQSLLDKSLLRRRDADLGPRYWMLETIREYAAVRLDEAREHDVACAEHARWCIDFVESVPDARQGNEGAFRALQSEHDNIRFALAWLQVAGDGDGALRLAGGQLPYFWWACGHMREGDRWLEGALSIRGEQAREHRGRALTSVSFLAGELREVERAVERAAEAAHIWTELGDDDWLIRTLNGAGCALLAAGRHEDASTYFAPALDRAMQTGLDRWISTLNANMAEVALENGDAAHARALLVGAVQRARAGGMRVDLITALPGLGVLDALDGRPEALDELKEGLTIAQELAFVNAAPQFLSGISLVASDSGETEVAVLLAAAAEALAHRIEDIGSAREIEARRRVFAAAGATFTERELAALRARGSALGVDEAVEMALALG